jgi:hypothetical protein
VFFSPFFYLSPEPWKMCYLLSLSYLVILLLIVSNYNYLFCQLHPLSFDFYIKFILLFYNISGLTFNVLISNLDSLLFL